MIVHTSAVLAIAFGEPDRDRFSAALGAANRRRMSAVSWFEASMVAESPSRGGARSQFEALLRAEAIEVVDFTFSQAQIARDAWRIFGKGSGHKAQLNFGDCMAYALAKEGGEPLLFKGNDFSHTDIEPALKD